MRSLEDAIIPPYSGAHVRDHGGKGRRALLDVLAVALRETMSPSSQPTRGRILSRSIRRSRQKNSSWGIAISTLMTHIGGILGPLIAWFNVDEVTNVASCGSQILGELWSHSIAEVCLGMTGHYRR